MLCITNERLLELAQGSGSPARIHEVRALASRLAQDQGLTDSPTQKVMSEGESYDAWVHSQLFAPVPGPIDSWSAWKASAARGMLLADVCPNAAESNAELDHGATVLRIQAALGCTDGGWISPDVILLRIEQLKASVWPGRMVPAWAVSFANVQKTAPTPGYREAFEAWASAETPPYDLTLSQYGEHTRYAAISTLYASKGYAGAVDAGFGAEWAQTKADALLARLVRYNAVAVQNNGYDWGVEMQSNVSGRFVEADDIGILLKAILAPSDQT